MTFADMDELRAYRNTLLHDSDAWVLEDFPLTDPTLIKKAEIKAYRNQLRDWPATETDLANATVPVKPTL